MADKTILGEDMADARSALRNQGLSLMLKGGFYGAVVFVSILVFMFVLGGIAMLLPPESKQMPDPNVGQRSAIEVPLEARAA